MKKFRLISLAAAGVAAAITITASAASSLIKEERDRNECKIKLLDQFNRGEIECMHTDNEIVGEDGLTDMDRELENILAEHPIPAVSITEAELSAMYANNIRLSLEKVETSGMSYAMWTNTFEVPDVANFASQFYGPRWFVPSAEKNGGADITVARGYVGLYAKVSARATYKMSDGTTVTTRDFQEGNSSGYEARPDIVKNATLIKADLYYYLNDGPASYTPYKEVAVVHIVQGN